MNKKEKNMNKIKKMSLLLLIPLVLAGCKPDPSSSDDPTSTSEETPSTSVDPSTSTEQPSDSGSDGTSQGGIEQQVTILQIDAPAFVDSYRANIGEKSNKRNEFMDRGQGYFVGTDNEFRFFPEVLATDDEDQIVEITNYPMNTKVELKVLGEFVEQKGSNLEELVTIDKENNTYKFSEEAVGESIRLTVWPEGSIYENKERFQTSFAFEVAKGFNVYTQEDLHHYDNLNEEWVAYRSEKGLTQIDINGVILHNDIKIKAEHLPKGFFYQETDSDVKQDDGDIDRVVGSLRDFKYLYHRGFEGEEEFVFNGNYFNFDFSAIPLIVRENGRIDASAGKVVSHSAVLGAGKEAFLPEGVEPTKFTLKNMSIIGNANRTEAVEKSGGVIFNKMWSVDAEVYNTIITQAFTFYFPHFHTPKMLINKSRGYDSFSSMFYNWGGSNLIIRDSEFIGAGGPVIISDHVDHDNDGEGGYISGTVVENSVLESFVSGTENWFTLVGAAAAATQLTGVGMFLSQYGTNGILRTVEIEGKPVAQFSLIGVIKSSKMQGVAFDKIQGTFKVDENTPLDFRSPLMNATAGQDVRAPRIQSGDGRFVIMGQQGDQQFLIDPLTEQMVPTYAVSNTNVFGGDVLNIYFNIQTGEVPDAGFMGLIFQLVDQE